MLRQAMGDFLEGDAGGEEVKDHSIDGCFDVRSGNKGRAALTDQVHGYWSAQKFRLTKPFLDRLLGIPCPDLGVPAPHVTLANVVRPHFYRDFVPRLQPACFGPWGIYLT